jgi:hypothetical protein
VSYFEAQICTYGHVITPDLGRKNGDGMESSARSAELPRCSPASAAKPSAGGFPMAELSEMDRNELPDIIENLVGIHRGPAYL